MSDNFVAGFRVLGSGETTTANYVWDPLGLQWVAMTQPSGSGGGGTGGADVQYTSGTTIATPVGNVVLGQNSSNVVKALTVDSSGNLNVTVSNPTTTVAVNNFPSTQVVSGTVAVSNLPATQPVSGTFWQATQPVSIASSVAVTGTFWQATQPVSKAPVPLTPASPNSATVGTASASVLAANASRKGCVITNLSANNISLGLGVAAVLNKGITLTQNGVWVMDDYTFTTAQIFAIAAGASSALAIQELN